MENKEQPRTHFKGDSSRETLKVRSHQRVQSQEQPARAHTYGANAKKNPQKPQTLKKNPNKKIPHQKKTFMFKKMFFCYLLFLTQITSFLLETSKLPQHCFFPEKKLFLFLQLKQCYCYCNRLLQIIIFIVLRIILSL